MASIRDLGSGDLAQALHIGARPGGSSYYEAALENPSSNQNLRVSRVSNSHLSAKSHIWKYFRVFGDFFCLKIAKFSLKSAERAATRAW